MKTKKILRKIMFGALILTGTSLCIAATIAPTLMPVLAPVGSICIAGALAMFEGALARPNNSSSSSSSSSSSDNRNLDNVIQISDNVKCRPKSLIFSNKNEKADTSYEDKNLPSQKKLPMRQ